MADSDECLTFVRTIITGTELRPPLTIYKASAGSGKTYTLALEYIKLLLGVKNAETGSYCLNSEKYCRLRQKSRHAHILAITFTNKATEEMKERIVNELNALSQVPQPGTRDANYAGTLTSMFGCTRDELANAARLALNELLFDYSHFNVSTIDSFFQTVLREFAREVDRQGDFEVELDDSIAVGNGVSMMLDDLNYGNPVNGSRMQSWIYDYMLNRIRESGRHNLLDRSSSLFSGLVDFVCKSCGEDYKEYANELQKYLADPARLRNFRSQVKAVIERQTDTLRQRARDVVSALALDDYNTDVLKSIGSYLNAIISGEEPSAKGLELKAMQALLSGDYDEKTIFTASKCRSTGKGKSKITVYPSAGTCVCLEAFAHEYQKTYVTAGTLRPALPAADNLEFLGFALNYIEQFRRDNNLILLSDTNDLLGKIISDDEAPFIYERLGVFLNHYLIDEFQDTSRMQWKNLRPLVSSGIHDRHDSLIIGDEKQAIYRFRNSDSSMLHHTVADEDFPQLNSVKGSAPGENTNYRSAPDVVRFNNTVFARMARNLAVEGFENVVQTLPERKEPESDAYIRFSAPENVEAALDTMASDILRQQDSGYQWRDIAILVRTRREAATVVEFLRKSYPQISVLSEEALYLRNSSSVKLISGMLRLLDRACADDTDATRRSGKTDTIAMISRFDYYIGEGATPVDALHMALGDNVDRAEMNSAISRLRDMHASSLVSVVEQIIHQRIPPKQRRSEAAFICAFQDMVTDYCKRYPDSIHDFVKWYDKTGKHRALPAAPDIDAVQVMTVHKSKGLEWDCVHIPMATWPMVKETERWFHPKYPAIPAEITPPILLVKTSQLFDSDDSPYRDEYRMERQAQLTDNLNTTYVAFTRAARELIISAPCDRFGKISNVGKDIMDSLTLPLADNERNSGLLIDTAANFTGESTMEIGRPTMADSGKAEKKSGDRNTPAVIDLEDYCVFERDDTRELVSFPDITTELGKISDDGPEDIAARDIVDPVPPGCRGEELEQRRKAARRGILLHAVMAEMNSRHDLDSALQRISTAIALDPAATEEIRALLKPAIDSADSRIDRWFDPQGRLLSEQSILMPDGTVLRPDRIVIHSDGSVDLVDYKFTSAMRNSHQHQLRDYCLMLRDMGYSKVCGHLWYPLLGKIATEKIS
ncbi:MAG: UvrD-helicase domain-containing protein [Muribaculaceae bacterium]|nr:UvrD-helicase domain-containing protein [Muribaculaceae bacterium]